MRRRHFLSSTAVTTTAAALTVPSHQAAQQPSDLRDFVPIGLAPSPAPLAPHSHLALNTTGTARILQLTDLHFFAAHADHGDSRDRQTVDDVSRIIDATRPDLVAVTGDLWHDVPGISDGKVLDTCIPFLENLGAPWLFVWGNHDRVTDVPTTQAALENARGSLYRGGGSGGNYRCSLVTPDNTPACDLVCLNSTNQGLQKPQESWLENLATSPHQIAPLALAFFHIPLLDYDTAWHHGSPRGVRHEDVYTYGEDGSAITALRKIKPLQACFCGHDHVNDYGATTGDIELVYGRATGHAGYGADKLRKGAKLISLDLTSHRHHWQTVFPDTTIQNI